MSCCAIIKLAGLLCLYNQASYFLFLAWSHPSYILASISSPSLHLLRMQLLLYTNQCFTISQPSLVNISNFLHMWHTWVFPWQLKCLSQKQLQLSIHTVIAKKNQFSFSSHKLSLQCWEYIQQTRIRTQCSYNWCRVSCNHRLLSLLHSLWKHCRPDLW